MFDPNSRYAKVPTFTAVDRRGRTVNVVEPAPALDQGLAGYHVRRDGQRLDLLAGRYLQDATRFWAIAALNDVMLPEALTLADEIAIPERS